MGTRLDQADDQGFPIRDQISVSRRQLWQSAIKVPASIQAHDIYVLGKRNDYTDSGIPVFAFACKWKAEHSHRIFTSIWAAAARRSSQKDPKTHISTSSYWCDRDPAKDEGDVHQNYGGVFCRRQSSFQRSPQQPNNIQHTILRHRQERKELLLLARDGTCRSLVDYLFGVN